MHRATALLTGAVFVLGTHVARAACDTTTTTTLPPCGSVSAPACGGDCPFKSSCETSPTEAGPACACVSGEGGPCGGNILAPPPVCAPGLTCQQSNPDVTGICVKEPCIPFFQSGCTRTSDCCVPCGNGPPPCAVCLQGQCMGAP